MEIKDSSTTKFVQEAVLISNKSYGQRRFNSFTKKEQSLFTKKMGLKTRVRDNFAPETIEEINAIWREQREDTDLSVGSMIYILIDEDDFFFWREYESPEGKWYKAGNTTKSYNGMLRVELSIGEADGKFNY